MASTSARTAVSPAPAVALKRELSLRDVVFFTVAGTLGTRWLSAAANAGPASITLWFLAALLFLVPLASAVAVLSRKYPDQGGLYLWARGEFGETQGFLAFWFYYCGIALWFPNAVMAYAAMAVYALGPEYTHLAENRTYVITASLAIIWIALGSHLVGLRIGKWTQILGGIGTYCLGAALVLAAVLVASHRGSATPMNLAPALSWDTLNFWTQMTFAITGLELAAMLGSEIRDAQSVLPRAAWISSLLCGGFYAATTAALLAILPPGKINILHGLAEGGRVAGLELGWPWFGPLFASLILVGAVGQFGALGAAASRLPAVVGADRFLPESLAKLHPTWGTPYLSILMLGAIATGSLLVVQFGETLKAAYQLLVDLMILVVFIPFLHIFGGAWRLGRRVSASVGLAVSLMAIACSAIPASHVENVWLFEAKLFGGAALIAATGWMLFRRAKARA